jgi:CMP-N-acetylneuraminic acid synthetase
MAGRKYLGLIPARGGSKRIPEKNLKALAGKPLIVHTIDAALGSSSLWKVIVSTEDSGIARIAKGAGAEVPFMRPKHLAKDDSPMLDVIKHAMEYYNTEGMTPTAVVILQPTSPLRTSHDIDESVSLFQESGADTLVSVRGNTLKLTTFAYPKSEGDELWLKKPENATPSEAFQINGAIYIASVKSIISTGSFYGEKIIGHRMPAERSVDIDTDDDWTLAEKLLEGAR